MLRERILFLKIQNLICDEEDLLSLPLEVQSAHMRSVEIDIVRREVSSTGMALKGRERRDDHQVIL